ncbi:MAG: acetyl-CoA carboxylase biotin carboxyl carrier protein [Clostridium sp.]|nr:acetyl-CoA carboxylase biotin carboxyl carrier protein [Clostridium sp.]
MEFEKVKELIETVNSSDISLFELKTDTIFVKIDKSLDRSEKEYNSEASVEKVRENTAKEEKLIEKEETIKDDVEEITKPVEIEEDEKDLVVIKAPMVGTFYSSPSQDSASFVSVGDNVKTGDTLCIIEAMKLMNEIESQVNGVIKKVLVNDGEMVEYGQPIFKVKEA